MTNSHRYNIRASLRGGDRRSIGRSNEIVKNVLDNPKSFPALFKEMWNIDAVISMRAADAVEKITRTHLPLIQRLKRELLGLAEETEQQEMRWHMAAIIPRLQLTARERGKAAQTLRRYLNDKSSIVRTFALQGLWDLSANDRELRQQAEDLLRAALQTGTAAMRARAKRLLQQTNKH